MRPTVVLVNRATETTNGGRQPPASSPGSSRPRRRPPEVLTELEAIALIKARSQRAPSGVRNRALIAVLWRSGLRTSEALALELRDLDLEAGTIRVRHGKGDRSRTVGLDEQTAARLDSSYVRRLLPRLARKAGISRRVHAHGLRHTYAAELARERTPINVIRDALGHSTLAVTDRYLRDVRCT